MRDERNSAFTAYVLAWLTTEMFECNSCLYIEAYEEIQTIEKSGHVTKCQIRIARRVAQFIYAEAQRASNR